MHRTLIVPKRKKETWFWSASFSVFRTPFSNWVQALFKPTRAHWKTSALSQAWPIQISFTFSLASHFWESEDSQMSYYSSFIPRKKPKVVRSYRCIFSNRHSLSSFMKVVQKKNILVFSIAILINRKNLGIAFRFLVSNSVFVNCWLEFLIQVLNLKLFFIGWLHFLKKYFVPLRRNVDDPIMPEGTCCR